MQLPSELAKRFVDDIVSSPLNIALVCLIVYFSYKLFKKDDSTDNRENKDSQSKRLPPMEKQDFTPEELKKYDGKQSDGRILFAVLGKVFDVSNAAHHYGPGGSYSIFAGRDASRALATFSVDESAFKDGYDDLSDLKPSQLESVKEWEQQFTGITRIYSSFI